MAITAVIAIDILKKLTIVSALTTCNRISANKQINTSERLIAKDIPNTCPFKISIFANTITQEITNPNKSIKLHIRFSARIRLSEDSDELFPYVS